MVGGGDIIYAPAHGSYSNICQSFFEGNGCKQGKTIIIKTEDMVPRKEGAD